MTTVVLDGTGAREYRRQVAFTRAFSAPPEVMIGLSMLDVNPGTNDRVRVKADNITQAGFDVVFSTWADTKIYGLGANWIAVEQ
jgi:H-type lectin domain-containing protein